MSDRHSTYCCDCFCFGNFEVLHPSPYAGFITIILSGGDIAFLLYFIEHYSKSIPEIADKSYMSLLAYAELNSDIEEEGEQMQERMI
jgi:hypothetical protein